MKKIILKLSVFLFCMLLITATSFSQDVTIDYAAWNPSSPPCDVFAAAINVPAVINGVAGTIQHQTQIGQPTYNTSGKFIQLECKYVNASSTLGTKYRIAYNLK